MSDYGYYSYDRAPRGSSGGTIALVVIVLLLVIALVALIIDTYFYPFITGQMYGGECKTKEDCRQGLGCSTDARDPTVKICQETTAGDCSKCNTADATTCKPFCTCPEITQAACTTKFTNLKAT